MPAALSLSPDPSATPEGRAESGKAARRAVPRSSHGEWKPAADRRDPLEILDEEARTRVQDLIPLRHGRMLVSPFTFYRGAAGIMAADLAGTPNSGQRVQLCGDAHLSNFGGFAAPDRRLVFDVNDFDETLPGPWEWDVKRLAASFEIGARDRGFRGRDRRSVVAAAAEEYRVSMRRLADLGNLDLWYLRSDGEGLEDSYAAGISKEARRIFERNVAKARAKTSMRAFDRLTERVDGRIRIAANPPLIVPVEDLLGEGQAGEADEAIGAMLATYRRTLAPQNRHLFDSYRYVHAARKVVGVGSVGTRAWIALFVGRDDGDPLFLQIKEAQSSVLEPFAGRSRVRHHGQRVVEGQRLTQAAGDILLGWMTSPGLDGVERHYYVRQLWDQKASAQVERMKPDHMTAYARLCGATLARAHARTGDRIAIAAYLGSGETFEGAMVRFAAAYADQNEIDYQAMLQAVSDGRLEADREVI